MYTGPVLVEHGAAFPGRVGNHFVVVNRRQQTDIDIAVVNDFYTNHLEKDYVGGTLLRTDNDHLYSAADATDVRIITCVALLMRPTFG